MRHWAASCAVLLMVGCADGAVGTGDDVDDPTVGGDAGSAGRDAGVGPAPPDAGSDAAASPSARDAATPDAGRGSDAGAEPSSPPAFERVDDLHLYLNLGDSQAAGYNASGDYGWSRLLHENRSLPGADTSAYEGEDLRSLHPGLEHVDRAEGGWTSSDVLADLRDVIGSLPTGGEGDDTLVTIGVGGNDFKGSRSAMLCRSCDGGCLIEAVGGSCPEGADTEGVAERLTSNLAEMFRLLEDRYLDPSRGRELVVVVTNVYDPTDGMGTIPDRYTDGFCEDLQQVDVVPPPYDDRIVSSLLDNLAYLNGEMRRVVEDNGGIVADHHAMFLGHGMNASGTERWMDDDCTHPNDRGHHRIRRLVYEQLTGETP